MTIKQWLSDVRYDNYSGLIYNKIKDKTKYPAVLRPIGFNAMRHEFKTDDECDKFRHEVGEFIAQAIREKIERLKNK